MLKNRMLTFEELISDKRVLMKIRKAFSIEIPLSEFIELTRHIPYVIDSNFAVKNCECILKIQ